MLLRNYVLFSSSLRSLWTSDRTAAAAGQEPVTVITGMRRGAASPGHRRALGRGPVIKGQRRAECGRLVGQWGRTGQRGSAQLRAALRVTEHAEHRGGEALRIAGWHQQGAILAGP